jgi:thiol-disulfide isomerase/thioredoxin
VLVPLLAACIAPLSQGPEGTWCASLATPGGPLEFRIDLERRGDAWAAFLVNGRERIEVPRVWFDGRELLLELPHYDSRIRAELADGRLAGSWEKRRGPEERAALAFEAVTPCAGPAPASGSCAGRWRADFSDDEQDSVALFESLDGGLAGTFLTPTGDYRYLWGTCGPEGLELSCFDGAHAFLFRARLLEDGSLAGDFWSGDWHHATWRAWRDEEALLADPFGQSRWDERTSLADLGFPDLEGRWRSLAEPGLMGRATLLVVLGSWCPNCHDEARFLSELLAAHGQRGLSILALAFELTGEPERDAGQVRLFAARHELDIPYFLCGTADKELATQALGALDRVRAFPTTVFFGPDGRARAVHTGFAGPATGAEHAALRAEFERRIEQLFSEPAADDAQVWAWLTAATWFSEQEFAGASYAFREGPGAGREALYELHGSGQPVIEREVLPVRIAGDAVWIGERVWKLDREAGVMLDPQDVGGRLHPRGSAAPLLALQGYRDDEASLLKALADRDPLVRREALYALARQREPHAARGLSEVLPLLAEPRLELRLVATWAAGRCGEAGARESLLAQLAHGNAALRRESVRALGRLCGRMPDLRERLASLARDPDPLVRAAVAALAR